MTTNPYDPTRDPAAQPPEPPYRDDLPPAAAPAQTAPLGGTAPVGQAAAPDGTRVFGEAVTYTTPQQTETFAAAEAVPAHEGAVNDAPQGQHPYQGHHAAAGYGQPPAAPGAPAAAAAPAKGGAGKTFLFGFLGALVACVICLGGFAAWGAFNGSGGATTTLGATDSSVIDAVEEGQTLAEAVAAKALPSVVAVYNYQEQAASGLYGYGGSSTSSGDSLQAAGMGSGVVISEDGYILTNYHVVEGASVVRVTVDGTERDAKYIGGDKSSDVAVVRVNDTEGLVPVDLGNSDDLHIGEWVMTIGAPLGLEQSVATGVVSATNRSTIMNSNEESGSFYGSTSPDYTYYPNMIQTDAVINPGNSGGALVDADGKLIGINTMISSYSGDYAGVGFAIPVNYAMGIASDIIAGKTPTHAMLGVSITTVNAQTAQRFGLKATSGAYINAITAGTGAADSDLQVGDIITAIDGTAVASATDVTLEVRAHNVGQTVTVTVDRNGATQEIPVVLSSDENLLSSGQPQSDNGDSQQAPSSPYGSDGGQNQRNLEDLLRLFGM